MSGAGPSLRDPTVQSFLLFAAAIVVAFVLIIGESDILVARIQAAPAAQDDAPPERVAGPAFIRRQRTTAPAVDPDPTATQPKVVADSSGTKRVHFEGTPVSNPCVSGTDDACDRRALDPFLEGLSRLENNQPGVVRITYLGDSMVASSYISKPLRELLQRKFGDGGTGFVYLGKPSRFFIRASVKHRITKNWAVRSISGKPIKDALYGLGGVSFSAGMGERVVISTTKKGRIGSRVSRYELYYLAHPWGGNIGISIDGSKETLLSTKSEKTMAAFHTIDVPDGGHSITLKIRSGLVRAYGLVMERDKGVVLDNLGVVGSSALALGKIDEAHWAKQLRHRAPHLVVVQLGSNEADWTPNFPKAHAKYEERYTTVLERIRKSVPNAACLAVAPLDQGVKRKKRIVSNPTMPGLVKAQERAARRTGCAFWNTFEYMGGAGSYKRWYRHKWLWTDMAHPTTIGGKKLAKAMSQALLARFAEMKLRRAN